MSEDAAPPTPPKKKKPEPNKATKPVLPLVPTIFIKNNLLQKVMVNLLKDDGTSLGIEIEAKGKRKWPKQDDYGPHVAILRQKGFISIIV